MDKNNELYEIIRPLEFSEMNELSWDYIEDCDIEDDEEFEDEEFEDLFNTFYG